MPNFDLKQVLSFILRDKRFYMLILLTVLGSMLFLAASLVYGPAGVLFSIALVVYLSCINVAWIVYALYVYNTLYAKTTAKRSVRYI